MNKKDRFKLEEIMVKHDIRTSLEEGEILPLNT